MEEPHSQGAAFVGSPSVGLMLPGCHCLSQAGCVGIWNLLNEAYEKFAKGTGILVIPLAAMMRSAVVAYLGSRNARFRASGKTIASPGTW